MVVDLICDVEIDFRDLCTRDLATGNFKRTPLFYIFIIGVQFVFDLVTSGLFSGSMDAAVRATCSWGA